MMLKNNCVISKFYIKKNIFFWIRQYDQAFLSIVSGPDWKPNNFIPLIYATDSVDCFIRVSSRAIFIFE